jgi:hypothetical protein
MLTANSAAILTDAFPREKRGFALGMNQVSGSATSLAVDRAAGSTGGEMPPSPSASAPS